MTFVLVFGTMTKKEGGIALSKTNLYDQGLGKIWHDVYVNYREGYSTSVTDYHEHEFYEINLILSGNVKILLGDRFEEGSQNRIVLTRPGTPHYISCTSDVLYSRLYLTFTCEFVEDRIPEWHDLSFLFGQSGTVITLTPSKPKSSRRSSNRFKGRPKPFASGS